MPVEHQGKTICPLENRNTKIDTHNYSLIIINYSLEACLRLGPVKTKKHPETISDF